MSEAPFDKLTASIDGVLEQNLGQLREQVTAAISAGGAEIVESIQSQATEAAETRAAEARQTQERETSESLAQATRRIRAESSVGGIAAALVDAAADYAGCTGLFVRKADRLTGFRARGLAEGVADDQFQRIDLSANSSSAFAHAAESKDQVVCDATERELSADVVRVFALASESRVTLYPVVLRDKVSAILLASGQNRDGGMNSPAIELLASVAEAWIEAVGTRKTAQLKQRSA